MPNDADHVPPTGPSDPTDGGPWPRPAIPPCPDGNPQRRVEIVGFRLKGADYLQLRVVLRYRHDRGICHVTVEEHDDRVLVCAVACMDDSPDERAGSCGCGRVCDCGRVCGCDCDCDCDCEPSETEGPCNVWLDEPLGERIVVDIESGRPLPLCVPGWGRDRLTEYIPRPAGLLWPPPE